MKTTKVKTGKQLLRIAYPELYAYLIETLSSNNIHSFDVQATSQQVDNGLEIQVKFGEGFKQEQLFTFEHEKTIEINDEFCKFCKELGETCKEVLIADYYKMIRP